MGIKTKMNTVCCCIILLITTTTNAELIGRLPVTSGGTDYQAYYDNQLDISWAANANINGNGTWDSHVTWVSSLSIEGVGGWRLPSMDVNGDGSIIDCTLTSTTQAACSDNEYGHLFYYGSGVTHGLGIKVSSPGSFNNVQDTIYWSSTESLTFATSSWTFRFLSDFGDQRTFGKSVDVFSSWAVHDGDVGAVPIPSAVWLFSSGLIGLVGLARRKHS